MTKCNPLLVGLIIVAAVVILCLLWNNQSRMQFFTQYADGTIISPGQQFPVGPIQIDRPSGPIQIGRPTSPIQRPQGPIQISRPSGPIQIRSGNGGQPESTMPQSQPMQVSTMPQNLPASTMPQGQPMPIPIIYSQPSGPRPQQLPIYHVTSPATVPYNCNGTILNCEAQAPITQRDQITAPTGYTMPTPDNIIPPSGGYTFPPINGSPSGPIFTQRDAPRADGNTITGWFTGQLSPTD